MVKVTQEVKQQVNQAAEAAIAIGEELNLHLEDADANSIQQAKMDNSMGKIVGAFIALMMLAAWKTITSRRLQRFGDKHYLEIEPDRFAAMQAMTRSMDTVRKTADDAIARAAASSKFSTNLEARRKILAGQLGRIKITAR